MNLQQIFKAINLRVTTSKQSSKTFYDMDCREFVFEDCYHNEVGSFFVIPDGDVCEVILNATLKDAEKGEINLTYKWLNSKYAEKRNFALQKMNKSDLNKELFVYANYSFELVESESAMLNMLQKVADGNFLHKADIQEEALSEDTFLELSKLSYRKDMSIKKLIENFIESGWTYAELNERFGKNKGVEFSSGNESSMELVENLNDIGSISKTPSIRNRVNSGDLAVRGFYQETGDVKPMKMKDDISRFENESHSHFQHEESQTIAMSVDSDSQEATSNLRKDFTYQVQMPDFINGTFQVGKGFVRNTVKEKAEKLDTSPTSLKERVHPQIKVQDELLHRYPGNKTVLSNMKHKSVLN